MKQNPVATMDAALNGARIRFEQTTGEPGAPVRLNADELSRQLRLGTGGYLPQRRAVLALSLLAMGAMGLISLFQMGLIRHLPEPPLKGLDADKVDGSAEAYTRLATPDAVLGLGSYAATCGLAAMGGRNRAHLRPWIPLALGGKIAFDVAQAWRMIRQQWTTQKAFCFWCLLCAGATFTTAALGFGEAREAALTVLRRGRVG
jgi:uncharacterized membrane protein